MTQPRPVALECADGRRLPGRWHPAAEGVAVVVIAPALGVPRRYYVAFATHLASHGLPTLTFDYRGVADAEAPGHVDRKVRMADWGKWDLSAAYATAQRLAPGRPLFHVGHSCGAQLMGLAQGHEQLRGLMLVAPSAPHAAHYPVPMRWAIQAIWRGLIPLLAAGRTRFPARRLGISSVDVPAPVMRDWARWGRSAHYLFSPEHGLDTSGYASLAIPALVWEFTDDDLAPPATVDALLARMPRLTVTRRTVTPADVGTRAIGHNGFFQRRHADTLWASAAEWLRQTAG